MSCGSVAVVENAAAKPKTLAAMWEDCVHIRERLRDNDNAGVLCIWPSKELIGHPTMTGIAMNCHALRILAEYWCPQQTSPKSPSVRMLKKEACPFSKHYDSIFTLFLMHDHSCTSQISIEGSEHTSLKGLTIFQFAFCPERFTTFGAWLRCQRMVGKCIWMPGHSRNCSHTGAGSQDVTKCPVGAR